MPKINEKPFYLGIDPGQSGGLAVISPDGVDAVRMPQTDRDTWKWVEGLPRDTVAAVERVGGYVPGSRGNIGSAMFKFGASYGKLLMALTAAGIPYETVSPQKWMRALGVPLRGTSQAKKARAMGIPLKGMSESKTAWKNRLKAHAQQLFPRVEVTMATADALLIAEYCKRRHEGTLDR